MSCTEGSRDSVPVTPGLSLPLRKVGASNWKLAEPQTVKLTGNQDLTRTGVSLGVTSPAFVLGSLPKPSLYLV